MLKGFLVIIKKDAVFSFCHTLSTIGPIPFLLPLKWKTKANCLLDSLGFQKNGVAVIDVYQKPTHTDWYVDFSFHHGNKIQFSLDPSVLASILCSTNEEKTHEFKQVTCTDTLKASGYPSAVISNISKKKPPSLVVPSPEELVSMFFKLIEPSETYQSFACPPNIHSLTAPLGRLLHNNGMEWSANQGKPFNRNFGFQSSGNLWISNVM